MLCFLRMRRLVCWILFGFLLESAEVALAQEWPNLPRSNAAVLIPAQEWPAKPGPRTIRVLVHYPGGKLDNVTADTGLMLTLHNWGGTDCAGTANPSTLTNRIRCCIQLWLTVMRRRHRTRCVLTAVRLTTACSMRSESHQRYQYCQTVFSV